MNARSRVVVFAGLAATFLLGCPGDDPGAGSCEELTPCGGDASGTWHATRGCSWSGPYDLAVDVAACHGLPSTVDHRYSGTVTYEGNVERTELSYEVGQQVTVPPACLEALGFDCDGLTDWSIEQFGIDGDWLECLPSDVGCDCTAGFGESDLYGEEEVSFVDGRIVYASGAAPVPYCVSGGRLGQLRAAPYFFER